MKERRKMNNGLRIKLCFGTKLIRLKVLKLVDINPNLKDAIYPIIYYHFCFQYAYVSQIKTLQSMTSSA